MINVLESKVCFILLAAVKTNNMEQIRGENKKGQKMSKVWGR